MATDQSDVKVVKPEELYEASEGDGFPGAPQVHIDDVEEVKPSEVTKHDSQEETKDESQEEGELQETPAAEEASEPVTHETDKVKTTYDTQDVPKPTMKAKIKEKVATLGDKLRPKDAVESKNADPHPGLL